MSRHRNGTVPEGNNNNSSSEEDDVFSALSRKKKGSTGSGKIVTKAKIDDGLNSDAKNDASTCEKTTTVLPPQTSSNKRHHSEVSDARKAKMDALLQELEAERMRAESSEMSSTNKNKNPRHGPERTRGSFVDPGDEYLTTNIFVGNLAPSITEEQMTDLFRQFGDLYSVKIMWPRTLEERSRNRHTGFVCFMNRQDAEDAMEACSETDPFKVGRQLMMRWGKNVKKVADGIPIVKKGTGGIGAQIQTKTHTENRTAANDVKATLAADPSNTIRVIPPSDVRKLQLITMVASFIAKDGEQLERMLAQQEAGNPDFQFLTLSCDASEQTKQEKVFYKWRVYSLCQGDGFHTWRTEPFKMIYPNGCTWIPPPRDDEAAKQEAEETKQKEQEIQIQKQTRRLQSTTRSYMTGRQLEQARRGGADAGAKLSNVELAQFEKLFKEELCASRESICQAMAFCFEKSGAAKQLSCMLKELILNNVPSTSIETITARLFLISDILFNSQQPGIRNAFMYRDAIEQMSPEVFTSIGVFARENFGRMSTGRLASSINAIFSAWVNWGVFDHAFIDELQARFEDKEIVSTAVTESNDVLPITDDTELPNIDPSESTISDKPRGDWTAISTDDFRGSDGSIKVDDDADADGEHVESFDLSYTSGKLHAGNADDEDGEPLDDESIPQYQHSSKNLTSANGDDPHGKSFDEKAIDAISTDDVDGEEICDDPDGEPVDDDADGESVDGEPLREVFDSEPNDAPPNDLDGEMI